MLHGLAAGHLQLFENVVIAAGDQDAGLPDAQLLHQAEVLPAGPDPGGDLREFQVQRHAALNGLPVLLTINKELRLPDAAVGAAQAAHHLVQGHDLIRGVGVHRLLPIPEGGIGDPDFLRHGHGNPPVVEGDLRHFLIIVHIPVEDGFLYILKGIAVIILFQKIGLGGYLQHGGLLSAALGCLLVWLCLCASV